MLEMYTIRYVVMCDTVVCTSKWHSTSTVSETSTILDNVYDFISKWNWLKWKIYSATMKLFDFHSFVSFVKHHLCGIYYRYSFSLHTHVLIKMGWHWCIQRSYIIYRQLHNLFFYLFKHFITNWNGKMKAYICIITIWYTLCHISCGLNRSINWYIVHQANPITKAIGARKEREAFRNIRISTLNTMSCGLISTEPASIRIERLLISCC